ncbi:hypothetical protein CRYUN_Cryun24cG0027600 [Craigia yunnanensis]
MFLFFHIPSSYYSLFFFQILVFSFSFSSYKHSFFFFFFIFFSFFSFFFSNLGFLFFLDEFQGSECKNFLKASTLCGYLSFSYSTFFLVANLCGNEILHTMLKEDGGIKALLGMVRSGNSDVVAQVARGMANFAKCESRAIVQGHRKGRSLLMDEGALEWLIANCNTASASTRRHIELALCHLAQNEDNAKDFTFSGGLQELQRISIESSREDIRNLAKKMLKSNTMLQGEMCSGWQ